MIFCYSYVKQLRDVVLIYTVVVQLLNCVQFFESPWTAGCQAPLSSFLSWSLLKFMSIKLVMLSNHLIFWRTLLLLPSIFPNIRVFSNEVALLIRWAKYWNFSFSISPSNEYLGLISFRIDWFELLAVQVTLKSSLAPQLERISSLHSAFFMV